MFCAHCGFDLPEGSRFCERCGTPVGQVAPSEPVTAAFNHSDQAPGQGIPADQPPYAAADQTLQMPPAQVQAIPQNQAAQPVAPPAPPASFSAPNGGPSGPAQGQQGKKVSPALIVVIVAAVVVAIALAVFFMSNNGQPTGSSGSDKSTGMEQSSSSSRSSGSGTSSSFDQSALEETALREARAAGMQVFSGTIRVTTWGERASEISPQLAKDFSSMANDTLVILEFDSPESMAGRSAGDMGQIQSRSAQTSINVGNDSLWQGLDGEHVTVAANADELLFPSDVAGALFSATGTVQLIAPLTESYVMTYGVPSFTAAASSDDYILADSATRTYSKSELEALDTYTLFLARNEIYARHGRQFQKKELQDYFAAKSWYSGTIPANDFSDDLLNDHEKANANAMLEIEKSRNSPYLQ